MKRLFYLHKVSSREKFEKAVLNMAKRKPAKLFNCYIIGDIFRIATGSKVLDFDFSDFEDDKEIVEWMEIAMKMLREKINDKVKCI